MEEKLAGNRRYDIDWLRNFGILLLFPFHSARVFDSYDPFYVKSESLSAGLSWFVALTSYWFMPLLFWLAGSASWYALQRRSARRYLKDRVDRLLVPFLFGIVLIVPPQGYFAILHYQGESAVTDYFSFLATFFTDFSDLSGYFGTFTPAHLWFILYLFVLSLAALPVFIAFKRSATGKVTGKINDSSAGLKVFTLLLIGLLLTQALPAPGGQNPFFFLIIFIIGFITCSDNGYQKTINQVRGKAMLFLLLSVPAWFILMQVNQGTASFPLTGFLLAVLKAWNVCLTLIVIIGYGNKHLNFHHRILPYLNEAAFPIYIIHQSILVVTGYFVLQLQTGVYPGFLMIMVLTLAISILIYEFVIKRTTLTRWMFGVKKQQKKSSLPSIGTRPSA